jgi:hypothetical protein
MGGSDGWLRALFIKASYDVLVRASSWTDTSFPDANSRTGAAFRLADWLAPRVEKYQPALMPAWKSLLDRLSSQLSGIQRNRLTTMARGMEAAAKARLKPDSKSQLTEDEDIVQQLLERASKVDDMTYKDFLLQEAALEAERKEDAPRSLDIAGRLSRPEAREKLDQWLHFSLATRAIKEKHLDEAKTHAFMLPAADQRVFVLTAISSELLKLKEKARALEVLREAERFATEADKTAHRIRALILIGNAISTIDKPAALAVLETAVRAGNRLSDYDFDQQQIVRTLRQGVDGSRVLVDVIDTADIAKLLTTLARWDFEKTLLAAQSFDRKTLQLSAVVTVASARLGQSRSD